MEDQEGESFEEYCFARIKETEIHGPLKALGLLDPQGNVSRDNFENAWRIWEGAQKEKLWSEIGVASSRAIPYEYLGNMDRAMQYYWVGTFYWAHPWPVNPNDREEMRIEHRCAYATPQLEAATCNDRIGNRGRATQLFEWATAHLTVTDEEKDQFRREGYYNMVWEYTIDRAFCLLCLERWEEALATAEEADKWLHMDRDRKEKFGAQYTPFHLLPVYLALARHRAHPSPENEREAKRRLMLNEFKVRVNHLRHGALLYIFELWSRNSDLMK